MEFIQPEGSFRFSEDALLLRDFALTHILKRFASVPAQPAESIENKKAHEDCETRIQEPFFPQMQKQPAFQARGVSPFTPDNPFFLLDLGAGCGIIGLSFLLHLPDELKKCFFVVGVERETALAEAARLNAKNLGLAQQYAVLCADIGQPQCGRQVMEVVQQAFLHKKWHNGRPFDAVVCNPPWRLEGSGKLSASPLRRRALFGTEATLPLFFSFADGMLKKNGSLFAIGGAFRLPDYFAALPPSLPAVRLKPVHRAEGNAQFILIQAQRSGAEFVLE